MSGSGPSLADVKKFVADGEQKYTTLDTTHLGNDLGSKAFTEIFEGLGANTVIDTVTMPRCGMKNPAAVLLADALKANTTITLLDIGYNNITGDGMVALAGALTENKTLVECKFHRQEADMGVSAETALVALWKTNVTLQRLYVTLHDRNCNTLNTRGEVRNKSIAACITAGKSWDHLDPATESARLEAAAQKRAEAKAAEELANAPISEKIESTGGPYTLKQLTCKPAFRPDDVDKKNRETYLPDEEFEGLFGMSKDEFAALPGWKKLNKKKEHSLH